MKKITLCAAALSAALLLCGCATEYPAEAYENHPVSDAFSEALVQSFADNEFDGTIDGLEPLSEANVREEFAVCADAILEESRFVYLSASQPDAAVIYVIRNPYQAQGLAVDENGNAELVQSGGHYQDISISYTIRPFYPVDTYHFTADESGTWEFVACSGFVVAQVIKTVGFVNDDLSPYSVTTEYTLTQFGPYVDDSVTPYLAGEHIDKDMRLSELTVTDGDKEVSTVPLSRGRE